MTSKRSTCSRRRFLGTLGAGVAASALGFSALIGSRRGTKRMIVLGIDGMYPALVTRFMQEGRMPNARRLAESGCFHPLQTSDPPQSPVAWSNVISGTHPGGHGIFDFIVRDPATLIPRFSTSRVEAPARTMRLGDMVLPLSAGRVVNLRRGPTFWVDLERAGIDSTVFRIPANFPPTESGARTLSGLGTPDIHGSYGLFSYYTDAADETRGDVAGGRIEKVGTDGAQPVRSVLRGPSNTFDRQGDAVHVPFEVWRDPVNAVAKVVVQGRELLLNEGEWSGWVRLRFPMLGRLAGVSGICRFYLKSVRQPFALYVSPINIDPSDPCLPISTPADYARELAREAGLFYTQGMPEDTSALSARVLNDEEYAGQATSVLEERLRLFDYEFARFERGFFFFYFSSLDLNSHAFWRTLDPAHPLYTDALARKHGGFLPWLYGRMDAVIGRAMTRLDDETMLAVVSDHGFSSFRRQVNLNSWLLDNGYAAPSGIVRRGEGDFFADIDWRRTKAYGLGLNGLYLNVRGREPYGTVAPAAADGLARELTARLKAMRDPATGMPVISNVWRPVEVYPGPYASEGPDLLVGYNRHYRASWATILGKYPPGAHVSDNMDPWSGDHAQDAQWVPGVFLCNRRIRTNRPALTDLAPTILASFGVPVPKAMTGRSLLGPSPPS